ncbi:MAG: hypothetical protein M3Z21_05065, partial [Pseudomonadota bacterium]|nr:hypothetical protein [Pseudomonadota bacterium]
MFGSAILEVAIGLIFVYLLVSLIVTAANELIASALKWRAANLEKGIRNLLNDPNAQRLADDFFAHPLIQGLAEAGKRPSYIPSRTFALALLDIVAPNTTGEPQKLTAIRNALNDTSIPDDVKKPLLVLLADAGNDLRRFQENVEVWFNNAMDRVAGWYRRKTQAMLLVLAVAFTAVLNIDTIAIVRALSVNPELRAALVEQAEKAVQPSPGQPAAPPAAGNA